MRDDRQHFFRAAGSGDLVTPKREQPATLQWQHKIPHSRISPDRLVIEIPIHEA